MRPIFAYLLIVAIVFVSLSLQTCCENSLAPTVESQYGLTGKILDTLGNPIEGAELYCIFYMNSFPEDLKKETSSVFKIDSTIFNFSLHQNFPNPFSNSTFVRFELPQRCAINLIITNIEKSKTYYKYDDSLNFGFYQMYIENLIVQEKLKNGIYNYTLSAIGEDGTFYNESNQLFTISDLGIPNAVSNHCGRFYFNYRDSYTGEKVYINSTGIPEIIEEYILTNTINLLIKKDGYKSDVVTITLYPEILLTQDIILKEL